MTFSMVTPSNLCIDRTDLGVRVGGEAPAVDARIVSTSLVKHLEKSSDECCPVVESDGCSSEFILRLNDIESGQLLIALDQKSMYAV